MDQNLTLIVLGILIMPKLSHKQIDVAERALREVMASYFHDECEIIFYRDGKKCHSYRFPNREEVPPDLKLIG